MVCDLSPAILLYLITAITIQLGRQKTDEQQDNAPDLCNLGVKMVLLVRKDKKMRIKHKNQTKF